MVKAYEVPLTICAVRISALLKQGIVLDHVKKCFEQEGGAAFFNEEAFIVQIPPHGGIWLPYGMLPFPALHADVPANGAPMLVAPFFSDALAKKLPAEILRAVLEYNSKHLSAVEANPVWDEAAKAFKAFVATLAS